MKSHAPGLPDQHVRAGWPIRVEKLDVRLVGLQMKKPFRTSFTTVMKRPVVIVRVLTSDGRLGYGEAAPLPDPNYTPETPEISFQVMERYLAPSVAGRTFESAEALTDAMAWVRGFPFAKAGIESAFWHVAAIGADMPLSRLFGGTNASVAAGASLGMEKDIGDLLRKVESRLSEGYRRIKLKIQPGWDAQVVDAVRRHFGDIHLTVDANAAYDLKDLETFKTLDAYGLMMIEQPLAFDDLVDHARLQSELKTPVCLDESIDSIAKARAALALRSARVINIKPGRVGGPAAARTIHHLCGQADVPVWMGGMFESGLGRAFNLALASMPGFSLPADMAPSTHYFEDDLVHSTFKVESDGTIHVPTDTGLGFEVDEEIIEAQTVHRKEIVG